MIDGERRDGRQRVFFPSKVNGGVMRRGVGRRGGEEKEAIVERLYDSG